MYGSVREPRSLGIDAGGTLTDTIFIDRAGAFVIGKAQSTPEEESKGFAHSVVDALGSWDMTPEQAFPSIASGIFSGTSMLNRLIERKGQRIGLIVTLGMEDYLRFERGVQTYLGYSYADCLHVVTHRHNEPLVPLDRIRGVGGRIDCTGEEAIPLYEEDARQAVAELLDRDVEGICINLLFSYKSSVHELRVRQIAEEVMAERGQTVPLYLSSELCPKRLDFPRLNTLMIEAYAAEPSRVQLNNVRERTRDYGARFDLRVMAGFGGTISVDSRQLAPTLVSGPIGGVVGAKYLSDRIGVRNIVCSDIGGTSFDVSLISDGHYHIASTSDILHFKLNLPLIRIESVGAGTGSLVRVNPVSGRIEFGPDSAGSRIGVSNRDGGVDTVSITDCDVVLGLINPDYFLGGDIKLDREHAVREVRQQIAEPLGLTVEKAAAGVVELFEDSLRREVHAMVLGKGFEPVDFALLCYGGGGPLHVGGYTSGLGFETVLVPSWAAGFSAFGCACADFAYRQECQVDVILDPVADDETKMQDLARINAAWSDLKDQVAEAFARNDIERNTVHFRPYLRIQYQGQINDIEVPVKFDAFSSPDQISEVIAAFEDTYAKIYAASARSPELGYQVTLAIMTGVVDVEKPALPEEPVLGEAPPAASKKPSRQVFWHDAWISADIYEMDLLKAGNVIQGMAVIEAPSTTFVVPPGHSAELDEHRIFHLSED